SMTWGWFDIGRSVQRPGQTRLSQTRQALRCIERLRIVAEDSPELLARLASPPGPFQDVARDVPQAKLERPRHVLPRGEGSEERERFAEPPQVGQRRGSHHRRLHTRL